MYFPRQLEAALLADLPEFGRLCRMAEQQERRDCKQQVAERMIKMV
ncbi:MAG: hypothetical protein R3E89_13060 [Thiolinea sp.]